MGHLDAAERCLSEFGGNALLESKRDSELSIRAAPERSAVLALGGRSAEAVRPFGRLPIDVFGREFDALLVHWGETAALEANNLGDVQRAAVLATLFRQIDAKNDLMNFTRQSRDQHFGAIGPTCQPETDQVEEARIELRAAIREFHAQLRATIAPRVAGASCGSANSRERRDRASA